MKKLMKVIMYGTLQGWKKHAKSVWGVWPDCVRVGGVVQGAADGKVGGLNCPPHSTTYALCLSKKQDKLLKTILIY